MTTAIRKSAHTAERIEAQLKRAGLPAFASKQQVADLLGVTPRTVERLVASRLLGSIKLTANGAVRFNRTEVARYIAAAGRGN